MSVCPVLGSVDLICLVSWNWPEDRDVPFHHATLLAATAEHQNVNPLKECRDSRNLLLPDHPVVALVKGHRHEHKHNSACIS